jgi:hypothetical protein
MANQFVVSVLLVLLPSHAIAQSDSSPIPERVRITASRTYEIPGLIKADGDRLSGVFTVVDESLIQVGPPNQPKPLVMPKPGKRIVGRAMALSKDALLFLPDRGSQTIAIPLAVIGQFEVSEGTPLAKSTRRLLGVGVGIGAGLTVAAVADSKCERSFTTGSFGPCGGAILLGAAVGVTSGVASTLWLGRIHWRTVPLEWFVSRLGQVSASSIPSGQ